MSDQPAQVECKRCRQRGPETYRYIGKLFVYDVDAAWRLVNDGRGYWTGFVPGIGDGAQYKFFIEGTGSTGYKRDPYAREVVGESYFDMARPCLCRNHALVAYGPGDTVVVSTEEQPVRFLLVAGRPLREPVAWYGPIVMNTQAELRTAFREYEQGTFVKHGRR